LMEVPGGQGSFGFENIDLTGISEVRLATVTREPVEEEYIFELRLDSPDGKIVGQVERSGQGRQTQEGLFMHSLSIPLNHDFDGGSHDIYIVSRPVADQASSPLILSEVTFLN